MRLRKNFLGIAAALLAPLLLAGCFSLSDQNRRAAKIVPEYNPTRNIIHPEVMLFHESEHVSKLYTKVNVSELLFARQKEGKPLQARFRVAYLLIKTDPPKTLMDSSEAIIRVDSLHWNSYVTSYVPIKGGFKGPYLLKVQVKDMNRGNEARFELVFDKRNPYAESNYLVMRHGTQKPVFRSFVSSDEQVHLRYRTGMADTLYVWRYNRIRDLSPPPYAKIEPDTFDTRPDTLYRVLDFHEKPFRFGKQGIYFLQVDTAKNGGKTVYNFGAHYPEVKTPRQMLEPLRYLLTRKEYQTILKKPNSKLAVDEFWLGAGGEIETARELINIYYMRVTFANIYFTALQEGWKTDRGMVYTLFGPPHAVKKSIQAEEWIYGDPNNLNNLQFIFRKTENPFTENLYILQRRTSYQENWAKAVDSWRGGKVYTF